MCEKPYMCCYPYVMVEQIFFVPFFSPFTKRRHETSFAVQKKDKAKPCPFLFKTKSIALCFSGRSLHSLFLQKSIRSSSLLQERPDHLEHFFRLTFLIPPFQIHSVLFCIIFGNLCKSFMGKSHAFLVHLTDFANNTR